MRKIAIGLILCSVAFGRARTSGYCQQGGQVTVTGGVQSATRIQQSYPQCILNIFYTGGAHGSVSTIGTAVTLTTGTLFNANSGWPGLSITINGSQYPIASVNSTTSITLTVPTSPSTQTNVAYAMPPTAPAAIYSDNNGTPQANPFTSSQTGYWGYYAADGTYDVKLSGGGIPMPFTLGAVSAFDPTQLVNTVSVKSSPYNAKCDTVNDDTASINNAAASVPAGTTLNIPAGCLMSNTLVIPQSITVQCTGGSAANLLISSSMSGSSDVIHIQAPSGGITGFVMRDCSLQPVSGTPAHYGINIDATSGVVSYFLLDHVNIGKFGSFGIATTFPSGINGIFNGQVKDSLIGNGVYANNIGDTVHFDDDTVTGASGYYIKQVSGAGNIEISGGAIVACGGGVLDGQIQIVSAMKPVIRHVELEPVSGCTVPASGALINMAGASGNVIQGASTQDLIVNMIPNTETNALRLDYVQGFHSTHDQFNLGMMGQVAINVTANAGDVILEDPALGPYTESLTGLLTDAGADTICKLNRFGVVYFGACLSASTSTKTVILGQPGQTNIPFFSLGINTAVPLSYNNLLVCLVNGTCTMQNSTPTTGNTLLALYGGSGQSSAVLAVGNSSNITKFSVSQDGDINFEGGITSGMETGITATAIVRNSAGTGTSNLVFTNGLLTGYTP